MADRVVKVILSAQVQDYMRGMEEAARKTRETGSEAEKLAQKRQAFSNIGRTAVAFGAAMTAASAAVAKTGIEYNTLQQTSRAALSTLLGGAEAANEQMDKLDEFARTSPFSKAVFIDAQQQLLGFGMEAEKVVPTLDAIQNAVAATGGSNQDIAELTRIIAQLAGGVKISAETLNQFGVRGIDAAKLIGDAMGKTGAQIREDISSGALDANEAIQALTDGMQANFGGAADGVKDTFDGATDRVKAAWRDLAADLTAPLVDPNGGGFLVDATNKVADFMRMIQGLPDPVKQGIGALSGLAGVAGLVGGTAILAVPKVVEFTNSLDALGLNGTAMRGRLGDVAGFLKGPWALGIAAGIAAIKGLEGVIERFQATSAELENTLTNATTAAEIFATAGQGKEIKWFRDVEADLGNLGENLDKSIDQWEHWWKRLPGVGYGSELAGFHDALRGMGEELGVMASTNLPAAQNAFSILAEETDGSRRQLWALLSRMPDLKDALVDQATAAGILVGDLSDVENQQKLLAFAMGETASGTAEATAASEENSAALAELEGKAEETTDAVEGLSDAIRNFAGAELDSREAARRFEAALDDLDKAIEKNGTSLDRTTEAGRSNEAALDAIAEAAKNNAAALYDLTGKEEDASAALRTGRDMLIRKLEAFGITGKEAEKYADKLGLIPDRIDTFIDVNTDDAQGKIDSLVEKNRNRAIDVIVNAVQGVADTFNANGNFYEYADGGIASYASGGFRGPDIYRGGENIHKFAEPETGWEAYISGKPDQKDRNVGVWMQAGERLGVLSQAAPSGPPVQVHQVIHVQPGMSEEDIQRAAMRAAANALA